MATVEPHRLSQYGTSYLVSFSYSQVGTVGRGTPAARTTRAAMRNTDNQRPGREFVAGVLLFRTLLSSLKVILRIET
jgi:hypothetical protein